MASVCDSRYKQRAVIEFLVAEKESVGNIHKRLCAVYGSYVPSDFHLFGPLKDTLLGTRFEDGESVVRAVRTWLREQETSWYREGMHALVSRWRKAVDVDGDYVEK